MTNISKYDRILGIDPGSQIAGFALLEATQDDALLPSHFVVVELGVIDVRKHRSSTERLGMLHECLFKLIGELEPAHFSIEKAFVGNNANSALKLGEARGALISAARRHKIPVHELTPAQIKKTVAGNGKASKEDIKLAVTNLFKLDGAKLPYDAYDALAIALSFCCSLSSNLATPSKRRKGLSMQDVARGFTTTKEPTAQTFQRKGM